MKKYLVCSCFEDKKIQLVEVDFLEEGKCTDFSSLKVLKTFNTEFEARNYMKLYEK